MFFLNNFERMTNESRDEMDAVFSSPELLSWGTRKWLKMLFLDHTFKLTTLGWFMCVIGLTSIS